MGGGGGGGGTLSIRGLHTNNASNLLTLQLWFPDIQLIGLAAQWKLNFFINSKQRCLFVLMYVNAWVRRGLRKRLPPVDPADEEGGPGWRPGQAYQ